MALSACETACEALYLTHHVRHADPNRDDLTKLCLDYDVPIATLQRVNHLPLGAHWGLRGVDILAIPTVAATKSGTRREVSLSPSAPAPNPEKERQYKIRRVVAACNSTDRATAVRYLQANEWSFFFAVRQFWADQMRADQMRADQMWADQMWESTHLTEPWDSACADEKWKLKHETKVKRKGLWGWLKEKLRK